MIGQSVLRFAKEFAEAPSKEGVLGSLDKLSANLRQKLGESLASIQKFDAPYEATTSSLDALKTYTTALNVFRTKGEAGSGNIVEAVRHIRTIVKEMKQLTVLGKEELVHESKKHQAPLELIEYVHEHGKLPVPNFSAGGIATPADAALVMQLGAEAVFVGAERGSDGDVSPGLDPAVGLQHDAPAQVGRGQRGVRFRQADVWPDYAGAAADTVDIEIYQHWLEPA